MKPKKEKRLKDRFNALNSEEKHDFIENVNKATGASESTIYRWIRGETKPRLTEQIAVATALGLNVRTLFPIVP